MGIILFLLFGLVIGFVARALMPGRQKMGWLATGAVGIAGSLLGGLVASAVSNTEPTRLQPAGIIGSILGALVVLAVYMWAAKRRLGGHGPLHT
ncbi:MAG TPA: GlsB/YeaQ/YmgE family stress response membrane protein [Polyangiaceae bacterium]